MNSWEKKFEKLSQGVATGRNKAVFRFICMCICICLCIYWHEDLKGTGRSMAVLLCICICKYMCIHICVYIYCHELLETNHFFGLRGRSTGRTITLLRKFSWLYAYVFIYIVTNS